MRNRLAGRQLRCMLGPAVDSDRRAVGGRCSMTKFATKTTHSHPLPPVDQAEWGDAGRDLDLTIQDGILIGFAIAAFFWVCALTAVL